MSSKRKKINLYIDISDLAKLKAIHKRTLIPMAVLIRQGIKTVIKKYAKS